MPLQEPAEPPIHDQQEAAAHPKLLELPDNLLHQVLCHLERAADLASVTASCAALRAMVGSTNWPSIASCEAHTWSPSLPRGLAWAAGRYPQVGGLVAGCGVVGRRQS